jgi:hypothetical protein
MQLRNNYEALREYVLSPVKTPSRPLGLDLWGKKGFMAWAETVFHQVPQMAPTRAPAQEALAAPPALAIPLANILNDWSNNHGGHNDKQ